jgi:hypothetical protein
MGRIVGTAQDCCTDSEYGAVGVVVLEDRHVELLWLSKLEEQ